MCVYFRYAHVYNTQILNTPTYTPTRTLVHTHAFESIHQNTHTHINRDFRPSLELVRRQRNKAWEWGACLLRLEECHRRNKEWGACPLRLEECRRREGGCRHLREACRHPQEVCLRQEVWEACLRRVRRRRSRR